MTTEDYNAYRVSGDYYAATIVAAALATDASLSRAVRTAWADEWRRIFSKTDEEDRKDLLERGFAPPRES